MKKISEARIPKGLNGWPNTAKVIYAEGGEP